MLKSGSKNKLVRRTKVVKASEVALLNDHFTESLGNNI